MGADIHLFLEKKLPNDTWATIQTFAPVPKVAIGLKTEHHYDWLFFQLDRRNYALFAELAGVRGFGPDPRGIPPDASPLYLQYVKEWDSDGHSHSWCSASTFVQSYINTLDRDTQVVKNYAAWVLDRGQNAAVLTFLDSYCAIRVREDDKAHDYRFCFFFDN